MDSLFEHHVIQNVALAVEALHACVISCHKRTDQAHGLLFQEAFLVLPIVFHQESARGFSAKIPPGILPKVLAEHRALTVGLQVRMELMAPLTLRALDLGFASECLALDVAPDGDTEILPARRKLSIEHRDEDVKTLLKAARRLGDVFAETSFDQICAQLRVSF